MEQESKERRMGDEPLPKREHEMTERATEGDVVFSMPLPIAMEATKMSKEAKPPPEELIAIVAETEADKVVIKTEAAAGNVALDVVVAGEDDNDNGDEVVLLTKSDKAVCTDDGFDDEDLQRALTYEIVFSTLIEKKVLAMKRDCEERKRAKRAKRKSIGRIFFSKKLFGGSGSRKSSVCRNGDGNGELLPPTTQLQAELVKISPQQLKHTKMTAANKPTTATISTAVADEIEAASASTESLRSQQQQKLQSKAKSKAKTATTAAVAEMLQPLSNADDSIASTLSNSSGKNSYSHVIKRSLLVRAQTHTHTPHAAAELFTSSSSSGGVESKSKRLSVGLNGNGISAAGGLPVSLLEQHTYDTTSLASGYDNGTGARLHTSTMADDSLTSIRDSIESLSFASSRYTVSFGGTEIIPPLPPQDDTASMLYERARAAKRLRILEAKSISAQCSPIFPRHPVKSISPPMHQIPAHAAATLTKATTIATTSSQFPVPPPSTSVQRLASATAVAPTAPAASIITMQTQTTQAAKPAKPDFLPHQVSYTESVYGCVSVADGDDGGGGGDGGAGDLEAAYTRYFSRQNTSEDSANLTVSTLLNQSDSLSLHVPIYASASFAPIHGEDRAGGYAASGAIKTSLSSLGDRYKSKSTSLLVVSGNGRSRPPPVTRPPSLLLQSPVELPQFTIPTEQLEELHITSNIISNSDRFSKVVDSSSFNNNMPISSSEASAIIKAQKFLYTNEPRASPLPSAQYFTTITTTAASASANPVSSFRNGGFDGAANVNGVIVTSSTVPGDTAKLHRMTSTSTGSSVAPTGCCTTTKSSSRDKEKQRFKPSWPSGHTGSDDEYRKRKRKYRRYHRCSDPVVVYPSSSGLQHCILSMPTNDPAHFQYNDDFVYDMQLQIESDKNDDLEEIVPSSNRRHRRHRHHRHKKRHRHKKPKILVQDLETQVVKVIDPDELSQRARWTIIATACLLLLMCLMLVGITLRMAPIIDDMVIAAFLCFCCSPREANAIVGGGLTSISDVPYAVRIQYQGKYVCTGTLVSARHVVTSASCVVGLKLNQLLVIAATTKLSQSGVRRAVTNKFVPTSFTAVDEYMDVSVLKLASPLSDIDDIKPVPLCRAGLVAGDRFRVSGWGKSHPDNAGYSEQIRTLQIGVWAAGLCKNKYPLRQNWSLFCGGRAGKLNYCTGDSGAGAIHNGQLCGIAVSQNLCSNDTLPGYYTDIMKVKAFIQKVKQL